jgi:hypothetical protein
VIALTDPKYGRRWLHCATGPDAVVAPELLFTENDTNTQRLFGHGEAGYSKDAFHRYVVDGETAAVNPARQGTKAAARYSATVAPGARITLRLRLNDIAPDSSLPFTAFDSIADGRRREADEYYAAVLPPTLSGDATKVARQALAGLLWSKQYYHYVVKDWLEGDSGQPAPPAERGGGRNHQWTHIYNADVLLMPDKWEYP